MQRSESGTKKDLIKVYTDCINCREIKQKCPEIWLDHNEGIIPRGFYFKSTNVKILIVGKNPGHLLDSMNEKDYYKNKSGRELFEAHQSFMEKLYSDMVNSKDRSLIFHKNLIKYIRLVLDMPNATYQEIYEHVAYTNLVKCSTKRERQRIRMSTMQCFYDKFLRQEIKLFKPRVVLALGREVERFLKKYENKVVYIRHPSRCYPKEEEQEILLGKKKEIQQFTAAK